MWNGIFVPMQKTVSNVKFVPLMEMSNADWAILEFEYLRSVAKNRISNLIMSGELVGFFHVNVEKAIKHGKHDYFWPATATAVQRFGSDNSHEFFKSEADEEFDTDYSTRVDYLVSLALLIPASTLSKLIGLVMEHYPDDTDVQRLEEKARVLDKQHLVLLIIIILLKHLTFEETEKLIESI